MTNLINPKPRFGFNPAAKTMYDYVVGRDVPIDKTYISSDGVWNLEKVRDLILAGETIESARIGNAPPKAPAPSKPIGVGALPPAQQRFTPVQAAALGVSVNERFGDLTPAQLANIKAKVTPARAIALGLTAEQKSFLGIGT